MPQIVYAIKIHEVTSGDLQIREIKIGRTKSLDRTISQYERNIRNPEVLDIWLPNEELGINTCEKGAHEIAGQYAYERQSEKFRFLQDSYEQFADNLSLLLNHISSDELRTIKERENNKEKNSDDEDENYTGKDKHEKNDVVPVDDATVATIRQDEIDGRDDALVAIFPSKKDGTRFLRQNNAWGFVRINKKPKYVAIYVSEDINAIRYIAEVDRIVPAKEAEPELEYPLDKYESFKYDKSKKVIFFKDGSFFRLQESIPSKSKKASPRSLRYTDVGRLKTADTAKDLFREESMDA